MNSEILNKLKVLLSQGYGGMFLVEKYTRAMDALLLDIFNSVDKEANIAFIATGGYGRAELAPYSDIDIMIFAPDRINTETAETLLHKLWDTGLIISHSFRTPDECIEESLKDINTRTSLLEARYVAGDRRMYDIFRKTVYPEILFRRKKSFVREKLKAMENRHLKTGNSVYMLEPEIKEGVGGLRDIHSAFWLSKVALKIREISDFSTLISPYDYKRLMGAYDFLLKARFCLHFDAGRKNDLLSFEYHEHVAACIGFRDSGKFRAAERFMRYYYLKSRTIKDITHNIVVACSRPYIIIRRDMNYRKINDEFAVSGGRLIVRKDNLFSEKPHKIMECFYLYSKTGRKFSDITRENIRANLLKINKKTRNSPVAINYFLDIFKGSRVYETLREMHETGVLARFVPEFGALRSLVVYEPYHMHTVDEHTLIAIRSLENLRTTKYGKLEYLREITEEIEHFDTLFLALLFHDIGKAIGRRHEEEGYKRLKGIMERFNIDSKKRMRIEFLVKNHILMPKMALHRETSDIEVIAGFAESVGDMENLKSINLITYADMSAVSPRFLTSWKEYLLLDLYDRTREYLLSVKGHRSEYISKLLKSSRKSMTKETVDFINEMPERYILSTTRDKVLDDCMLVERMKKVGFAMRIDHRVGGVAELVLCARDYPGLFSGIVGFLSSRGLNIVSGRIFTGSEGIVIDKISVSNWNQIWWKGLENDLKTGIKEIIEGKSVKIHRCPNKEKSLFDLFIEFDNEASEEYSLIELFSDDRVGLLFDISDIMSKKGITIISAMINTEAGLAHDVFYVQSENKEKLDYIVAQELLADLWRMLKE
ncbi:MAG: [protein-PII] uridylyltransferase [Nitrospirota bacterium]|nr:[protein-PII] uridylyltransferase [Nitrospirota bacterium]